MLNRQLFADKLYHLRIWQLAWPLMLSNITVPLLGLVDTAVIGHLPAAHYLAGVALSSTLFMLLYFAFNFLRMGSTGLSANAFGEHAPHKTTSEALVACRYLLTHALVIAIAVGLLLILNKAFIFDTALQLLGGSLAAQEQALIYSNIRILGAPACLMQFAIIGWLIGVQQTKGPLLILLTSNMVNIIFDVLFVIVFDFKVAGVAYATVIAEYTSVLVAFLYIHRLTRSAAHKAPNFRLRMAIFLQLFSVNIHIFLRTACLLGVFAFFTAQGARLGDNILAINAILINFLLIISNALDGFANAAEALCGQAYGAKDRKQLNTAFYNTGLWSLLIAILLSLAFLLGGPFIIAQLTNNAALINEAQQYLLWVSLLPLTAFLCFWLDGVFIGLNLSPKMFSSMLLASGLVFLPVWYITQAQLNHGLWMAMHAWLLARGLAMIVQLGKSKLLLSA